MTRHNARTDSNQADIVGALRKAGYMVILTHRMGEGFPDLLVVSKTNVPVLLEVKTPGEGLNEREAKWHLAYTGPKAIVKSAEDALAVMHAWDGVDMVDNAEW